MVTVKTLENDIRVVTDRMDHVRSAAIGVWVNAGSVWETAAESGISHFIEHMVFKGTARRSAEQIAAEMDAIGGNLNAFTSKECTCFYAKVLDEHLPIACDVLADLTLNATFDPAEMQKEKGVVLEEIAMTEDTPEDLVMETAGTSFFDGTALAPPILGERETVSAMTPSMIRAYMDRRYTSGNIVIACAGHFDDEALYALVREKFASVRTGAPSDKLAAQYPGGRRVSFVEKDVEQVHICMMLPGAPLGTKAQYTLSVLSNILGGGMSSRLFQNIREKRGLAYSIYSYPMSNVSTGALALYAGTGAKQADEVARLMLDELRNVRENGVTQEELTRCREQLLAGYVMSMEGSSSHMNAAGKVLLLQNREYNEAETLGRSECVTIEDIQAALPEYLNEAALCTAFVGRVNDKRAALTAAVGD